MDNHGDDRERIVRELRNWQEIFAAIPDGVWLLDLEGRIIQSNGKLEQRLGIGAEDTVGRHCYQIVHCTDGFVEGCPFQRRQQTGMPESAEMEDRQRGVWLQVTVSPIRDGSGAIAGAVHLVRDIPGRKRAEEALQQQLTRISLLNQITRAIAGRQELEEIFRTVLGQLEEHLSMDFGGVFLFDPQTDTLTIAARSPKSQALAAELGLAERTAIPVEHVASAMRIKKGEMLYLPDTAQEGRPNTQKMAQVGIRSVWLTPLAVEGQPIGVLTAGRRAVDGFSHEEGEFLRVLGEHVALAIHHAQLDHHLRKAYEDLRQTQQAVMQQERLRALGQMASGIAHDINNALSPVVGFTDLLLMTEPDLNERARQYLTHIKTAGEDITHIVARMREFYRPRDEERESLLPVSLNFLVRQVIGLTRPRWRDIPQEHGVAIEIRTDLDPGLPAVAGIESEIREALTNLIFNGVDAMPAGGTITIQTRVAPASPYVLLEVSDMGIGMSEETRQRCLEPFYSTRGERGTGLGLAMVYGVMQRHEGDIEIESALGQGTTVRLIFPARAAVRQGANLSRPPQGGGGMVLCRSCTSTTIRC